MNTPNSKFDHLFAIVRFDLPLEVSDLRTSVSVVGVFDEKWKAEAEVERVSGINDSSKCSYEVHTTRFKGIKSQ